MDTNTHLQIFTFILSLGVCITSSYQMKLSGDKYETWYWVGFFIYGVLGLGFYIYTWIFHDGHTYSALVRTIQSSIVFGSITGKLIGWRNK